MQATPHLEPEPGPVVEQQPAVAGRILLAPVMPREYPCAESGPGAGACKRPQQAAIVPDDQRAALGQAPAALDLHPRPPGRPPGSSMGVPDAPGPAPETAPDVG